MASRGVATTAQRNRHNLALIKRSGGRGSHAQDRPARRWQKGTGVRMLTPSPTPTRWNRHRVAMDPTVSMNAVATSRMWDLGCSTRRQPGRNLASRLHRMIPCSRTCRFGDAPGLNLARNHSAHLQALHGLHLRHPGNCPRVLLRTVDGRRGPWVAIESGTKL